MAAQSADLPLGAVCPRKVVEMSFKNIAEILASDLSNEMKELAIQRLHGQQETVDDTVTHAKLDDKGRYILRSVLTSVKPVTVGKVTRLVACTDDDKAACGRFLAVFGHAFKQNNKALQLTPLDKFVMRGSFQANGQRGEARQKDLSWVVGGWAIIGEQRLGGTGPAIPFTYHGYIGNAESTLCGRSSYNVKVDPAQATVEEQLRLTVENLLATIWGHNGDAEVFGDVSSTIEAAKAASRVGKFGLTLDKASTAGPRFIENGEIVDAKVVQAATQKRSVTPTTNPGTETTTTTGMTMSLRQQAQAIRQAKLRGEAAPVASNG